MIRSVSRWCALAGLAAALAVAAPAVSHTRDRLPVCPVGRAPTHGPTTPAGPDAPGACRARTPESASERSPRAGVTPGGYHHLGAGTGGEWGGVSGRVSVVDGSIRARTYDFVAARFLVKRDRGGGDIAWLEAGWAETGWAGVGRQRIYTFHTNSNTWQFYDQYALRPGDRVWLDLRTDRTNVWQAWLWWDDRWHLLTTQQLPIGDRAYVEQYVEVYADPRRSARITVPPVAVDHVRLRPPDRGDPRSWREDVATVGGDTGTPRPGGFCLTWTTRYDTWSAGTCRRA